MMKRIIFLLVTLTIFLECHAQWSVGLDGRLAPFERHTTHHAGTDITVGYSYDLPVGFYLMPSFGFFYKKYYDKDFLEGTSLTEGAKTIYTEDYQSGVDFSLVVGKKFNSRVGQWSVFTGPRYAYAYASKCWEDHLNRNSLDWRFGVGYTPIKHITIDIKVDVGCLKEERHFKYSGRQKTTLALGVRYNF